ncbi:HNH endonuclease [Lacticaseibacillus rhamnosus]|nr:HNH endonuclease [Lacticaseibacillus rhamnosus]
MEATLRQKQDRWKYNHITRNRSASKHEQYQFYKSKVWQSLRQQALTRDSHLCQYCLAQGRVTPGNTVDHVVPIEFDRSGMGTLSNLATICKDCHRAKTRWEQSYYGTGQQSSKLKEVPALESVSEISKIILKR